MTALLCADCSTPLAINPRRQGVRCRTCTSRTRVRTAEHREAARVSMCARWANPDERARLAAGARRGLQERLARDPDFAEARRANGRAQGARSAHLLNTPAGHPQRLAAGRSNHERRMAWCPFEYRADYRKLRKTYGYSAPRSRQIIEQQIARDRATYAATGALPQSDRGAWA